MQFFIYFVHWLLIICMLNTCTFCFRSDAHVLKKVSAFIAHLSPLEKKSLLLRLTVFSRQNKKHIHISDSRLDMIRSMIEKNM